MLNKIIDGISTILASEYGHPIYIDEVDQGLELPSFSILLINSSQDQQLGTRYKRDFLFDIHYFPQNSDDPTREILEVGSNLFMALELVQVLDKHTETLDLVRGEDMRMEITDGILHFFVKYRIFIRKILPEVPKMETLRIDESIKIGG